MLSEAKTTFDVNEIDQEVCWQRILNFLNVCVYDDNVTVGGVPPSHIDIYYKKRHCDVCFFLFCFFFFLGGGGGLVP